MFESGIETHLARQPFLKHGEKDEPYIKKSGVYFVKAQIVHEVKGAVEAVMQDKSQHTSYARAQRKNHVHELNELQDSPTSCV